MTYDYGRQTRVNKRSKSMTNASPFLKKLGLGASMGYVCSQVATNSKYQPFGFPWDEKGGPKIVIVKPRK